jgi:hypothetical protein
MTIEDLIATARAKKLRVANLYEGTDGKWRCALYRRATEAPTSWASGSGDDAVAALSAAISEATKPAAPKAKTVVDRFEELL